MQVGRPPKYATPEDMQAIVDTYFATRDVNNRPTVTGLALALGMSRQALIDYSNKDEFLDTVKSAKARVEEFNENRLFDPNATGCIFNLKNNFGWKDKTEQEHSGELNISRITRKIVD